MQGPNETNERDLAMCRRNPVLLVLVALVCACDSRQARPKCGRDTIVSVTPVGGDSAREVRLTPVCEGEDVKLP